jgi:hypothetical protein
MNGDDKHVLDEAALDAAFAAGALEVCPLHPDVTLCVLGTDEHEAYRIAFGRLKAGEIPVYNRPDRREYLREAVHTALTQGGATDCWRCTSLGITNYRE